MVIGIIEDDNLLRKALDTSMKNQGYTTILAASRKEAIKNIDQFCRFVDCRYWITGWRWNKSISGTSKKWKNPGNFFNCKR